MVWFPFFSGSVSPPVWDRSAICNVRTSGMQGLTVTTNQYGVLPWWDAALAWLDDPADRAAIYVAKLAAGDTHQLIELPCGPPLYDEPGQSYTPDRFGSRDWTTDYSKLVGLVDEVMSMGLIPVIFLGGDDGERGYPIAVKQLPEVISSLGGLATSLLFSPGWDGVFYGWTPEHIVQFGKQFRTLLPNGHLAIEMSEGHIPLGEGPTDWTPTGRMSDYDVLMVEFSPDNLHQGSTWEISGRLLEKYVRPTDQPASDDPSPPWYLKEGSPRGPFFAIPFEYDTYYWVRGRTEATVRRNQAYLASIGWNI